MRSVSVANVSLKYTLGEVTVMFLSCFSMVVLWFSSTSKERSYKGYKPEKWASPGPVRSLLGADGPHDVSVTGARDPARHHDHHVAGFEEASCFTCGGGERETER